MISRTGVTSFNDCLVEVGIASGTTYGVEELIDYFNTYSTMDIPYCTEDSFDDMKGFIAEGGHTFWRSTRYITSDDVWHFIEVYDAYGIRRPLDADPVTVYEYGVGIQFVNRSVVHNNTGTVYIEVWERPAGSLLLNTPVGLPVSVSKSQVLNESPEVIADSTATYELYYGQIPSGFIPLTIKWRWSESLPWNEVLI